MLTRNYETKSGKNVDWSVRREYSYKKDKPDTTFILEIKIVGKYTVTSEDWNYGGLSAFYTFFYGLEFLQAFIFYFLVILEKTK